MSERLPTSAFEAAGPNTYRASVLTRGPWHPDHQHAGPPIALVCREIERSAQEQGLTHIARLTANLLRPVPIGELRVDVSTEYSGRNVGHFAARLIAGGKEVARFTALAQRESPVPLPQALQGHPAPTPRHGPNESPPGEFRFGKGRIGYPDLVETRVAEGRFFDGPCAAWFRLRHPLLAGEEPSVYQRIAIAADSGNGISAILDFAKYSFVNSDLTINLLRRPQGEWVCLDARTHLGPDGCGVVESKLFDQTGLVGLATQSLLVRPRE
jgi:Thioesterase-like superfamily